jgi:hypothetical protein
LSHETTDAARTAVASVATVHRIVMPSMITAESGRGMSSTGRADDRRKRTHSTLALVFSKRQCRRNPDKTVRCQSNLQSDSYV